MTRRCEVRRYTSYHILILPGTNAHSPQEKSAHLSCHMKRSPRASPRRKKKPRDLAKARPEVSCGMKHPSTTISRTAAAGNTNPSLFLACLTVIVRLAVVRGFKVSTHPSTTDFKEGGGEHQLACLPHCHSAAGRGPRL